MTKASQIMALSKRGLSTRQIAEKVYGPDCNVEVKSAYIRTVIRQRKGRAKSKHDVTWLLRKYGGKTVADALRNRWRTDDNYRQKHRRNMAAYYKRKKAALAVAA